MIEKISRLIDNNRKFLITTHIDPDGDALGSAFSLYWALKSLEKNASVYLKDRIPYRYEFLPGPENIIHEIPSDAYDVILVVDCGNLFRIGSGHEKLRQMGTIVSIDHHNTNEGFGAFNLVDEHASSTAEILYRLFRSLEITITLEMALNIYTAIFTDTGSFRYENTSSSAFLIAEEMTRYGVKPAYVSRMVHENHPKERFLLLGQVISSMETYHDNMVALVSVTEEMFKSTNTTSEYTDGFVEYVREIRGVEVAILLREINKNKYKTSMRSKGKVDVAAIGSLFGGGGHKNAAGCVIEGTLEEVKNKLKEAFDKEFK
jgi:bifunctional oligoribonuclease and PAP phosphatase NrnA